MLAFILSLVVSALSAIAFLSSGPLFAGPSPIPDTVGIVDSEFVAPTSVARQTGWLAVPHLRQETNLCVPTSAAMILQFYGKTWSPREIKAWSLGRDYDAAAPFTDFTHTMFRDLLSGLRKRNIAWHDRGFSNDATGLKAGVEKLEAEVDAGRPLMVDTALYGGHTLVVAGYRHSGAEHFLLFVDPNIAAPGIRRIDIPTFGTIWNSGGAGADLRAAVFTQKPQ